jgi:hypothetical protein
MMDGESLFARDKADQSNHRALPLSSPQISKVNRAGAGDAVTGELPTR